MALSLQRGRTSKIEIKSREVQKFEIYNVRYIGVNYFISKYYRLDVSIYTCHSFISRI